MTAKDLTKMVLSPKQAQAVVEIADKLLTDYDLSEISKEKYYAEVARQFNKLNLL